MTRPVMSLGGVVDQHLDRDPRRFHGEIGDRVHGGLACRADIRLALADCRDVADGVAGGDQRLQRPDARLAGFIRARAQRQRQKHQ